MTHYVCTGSCHGESQRPGFCEAEFCSKEEQPLASCSCEDGVHKDAGKEPKEDTE